MANTIRLKWKNGGDWDGLMRGGRTSATICTVFQTIGNEVYLLTNDGDVVIGDAVQNGVRYYKITAVTKTGTKVKSFTLQTDSRFVPFQVNTQIIVLKQKVWSQQDLCLETILNQIGAYTYMVQSMFTSAVNLKDINAIPPRFYYPTKHKSLEGFLSLVGQTLRAYWDFPPIVTGIDGFPIFIPQLVQISGVKMWQWVDKKLGYVVSVDKKKKTLKTVPTMQMPCGAMIGRNTFALARKAPTQQSFYLALEPEYPDDLYKGDLIRFFTAAPSMDLWDLPPDPVAAECSVLDTVNNQVRVRYQTGDFKQNDSLYNIADPQSIGYTITQLEKHGNEYTLYLSPTPPDWAQNTILRKTTKDVYLPGKHAMPLIQKAMGTYLSYEKRSSVRLIITNSKLNWFSAQVARGTPEVGDIFHVVGDKTLYKITKIERENFYCDPTPRVAFGNSTELEIVRSVMNMACGIITPAYGEYYLSMHSTPLLYSNTTFQITGHEPETYDLKYNEGQNWSPNDVNNNAYCTHYLYKKGDYCYNGLQHPRTMEHLTELLYEFQRLITAMFDQIQIVSIYLTNETTMLEWLGLAQGHLGNDPYWKLCYEGII